jgi:hypothetical protein
MTPAVISRWDLSAERKLARMTANEAAIRKAYQVALDKDVAGRANYFTTEGTFTDESIEITYRGQELGRTVEV